jgi:hypothetical protein
VTDHGLAHLCGMSKLQELRLNECKNLTQAGVRAFKAALPQCEVEIEPA